jgi:hypothetical protein
LSSPKAQVKWGDNRKENKTQIKCRANFNDYYEQKRRKKCDERLIVIGISFEMKRWKNK